MPGDGVFDDQKNPAKPAPPYELWGAIATSANRVAQKERKGEIWYVAWVIFPTTQRPTSCYRVARKTAIGAEGWQVGNIIQVEKLLLRFWGLDQAHWREIWADWLPSKHPLERLVGAIEYLPM